MIEIRTINESEAVTFLQMICDVFDLDFARARTVFFNEPYFSLDRKWALLEDGQLASVLTVVPLQFGWGEAIGVASVATKPAFRGRGYATELLRTVLDKLAMPAYLFARDPSMYVRMGFEPVDTMVRAPLPPRSERGNEKMMPTEDIHSHYARWSDESPDRLRRDETRWKAWKWGMRACVPVDGGYVCVEGSLVREAICDKGIVWPVGQMTDWVGLGSMTRQMEIPFAEKEADLLAYGTVRRPQMFLTDQF